MIDSAWVLAAAVICSASRRARVRMLSASVCAAPRASVACCVASRARSSADVRPGLGLLDQTLGLRERGGVVLGGLAGQPLAVHGQHPPGLLDLAVHGGLGLLGLALGAGAQLADLLLGRQPELVGLALGAGQQVVGLALGVAPLLLGLGHQPSPVVVELLGVDDPQLLGVAAGVGLDRLGVAGGLLADLVGVALGDLAHLGGFLLGQAEHRARATAEAGVRRLLGFARLGELRSRARVIRASARVARWPNSVWSAASWRSRASTASLS